MKIAIIGGSGFIGRRLISRLHLEGDEVVLFSRNPERAGSILPGVCTELWHPENMSNLVNVLGKTDAIINLAGESIAAGRWTDGRKQKIRSSRLDATGIVIKALERSGKKPFVLINASAVGFYGNVPDGDVTESFPKGKDFLADLCSEWEFEALKGENLGLRVALLRTGIVLDKNEGALPKFITAFRSFAGGSPGSGKQWIPWIHIRDLTDAVTFILRNKNINGPVNICAPKPVDMYEFCKTLGRIIKRPVWFNIPPVVLKIALGEMAGPLLIQGQKAVPAKLIAFGFEFRFRDLEGALRDIIVSG
jgi:uncharacterized protein (TIGR01777 family)